MKKSVLLIGIDGASWDLITPWILEDKLPTLKRLYEEGVCGNLKSTIPPESGSAWVSLATGKNPGKHGIYGFMTSGKLINATQVKTKRIWHKLTEHGKRSCIINIPVTYPVEEINGYMVSSFLTPADEKVYSYPPELMDSLKRNDYKIDVKYERYGFMPDQRDIIEKRGELKKQLYDIMEKRYLTVKEFMDEKWDLFMINFKECDEFQHLFWDEKETILEFFQKLDSYIDNLINKFKEKNPNAFVLIVSDHGFASSPNRVFNLRVWMQQKNILYDKRTMIQKIVPPVYRKLTKIPFFSFISKSNKFKETREKFHRDSIESTPVYYKESGIYLDKNVYSGEEYEKLRGRIISELKEVKDPSTGEYVFKILGKNENIYFGPYANYGPDIIALSKHNYAASFSYESNELFDDIHLNIPGRHFSEIYGIFIASGDDIKTGKFNGLSILDINPTICHILDIPLDKDCDGQVLRTIFKIESPYYSKETKYSEEIQEKQKIKDALQKIKL